MKVLQPGNWTTATEWTGKVQCSQCAAVLEINVKDLVYHPGVNDPRDPDPPYTACTCPVCNKSLRLSVPPHVLTYVKNQQMSYDHYDPRYR